MARTTNPVITGEDMDGKIIHVKFIDGKRYKLQHPGNRVKMRWEKEVFNPTTGIDIEKFMDLAFEHCVIPDGQCGDPGLCPRRPVPPGHEVDPRCDRCPLARRQPPPDRRRTQVQPRLPRAQYPVVPDDELVQIHGDQTHRRGVRFRFRLRLLVIPVSGTDRTVRRALTCDCEGVCGISWLIVALFSHECHGDFGEARAARGPG